METSMPTLGSQQGALRAHRQYAMALQAEWRHLTHQRTSVARARSWNIGEAPIRSLDDVLFATGYRPPDTAMAADSTRAGGRSRALGFDAGEDGGNADLGALIAIAGQGDQLAGRVALQRILPGLRAKARRWTGGCAAAGIGGHDVLVELVATAWDVVVSYDVVKRPRRIAGNLIADTVGRTLVAPTRRRAATDEHCDPQVFVARHHTEQPHSACELAEVLLDARRAGVESRHIELFCDLWSADGSTDAVAARRGVTPRTVRSRRATAARYIHDAVADAVA